MRKLLLILALSLLPVVVQAQTVAYIQPAGSNTAPYDTWTKALSCLPSGTAAIRNTTYYIASGDYRGCGGTGLIDLSTANSGTLPITFKKAIASDHGAAGDWQASYGTGQAIFQPIRLQHDYWTFDGNCRTKATGSGTQGIRFDLQQPGSGTPAWYLTGTGVQVVNVGRYGSNVAANNVQLLCIEAKGSFEVAISTISRVSNVVTVTTATPHWFTTAMSASVGNTSNSTFNSITNAPITSVADNTHFTFSNTGIDTSGTGGSTSANNPSDWGVLFHGGTQTETNNYLAYSAIWHTGNSSISLHRNTNFVMEYNWMSLNSCATPTHTEGIEIKDGDINTTIRYNVQEDICGTAGIAFFSTPTHTDTFIYGNAFARTATSTQGNGYDNGVITVLNGNTITGALDIYNNSVINMGATGWSPNIFKSSSGGTQTIQNLDIRDNYWDSSVGDAGITTNSSGVCTVLGVTNCTLDYNAYCGGIGSAADLSPNKQTGCPSLIVSLASRNYHLAGATNAGFNFAAPFNTDPDGNIRGADGVWDRGAYEFLSGTAPPAQLTLSTTAVVFPSQMIGTTSQAQSIILQNTTSATLNFVSTVESGAEYAMTNPCPASLTQNQSCTLSVTFTPGGSGARPQGTIVITSNGTGSPQTITLNGTGITLPFVGLGMGRPGGMD